MRRTVAGAGLVVDHQKVTDAGNNGSYTKERRRDLGCEPGISKGAPVFRYWFGMALNDLRKYTATNVRLKVTLKSKLLPGRQS